jgi:hypothetical protein
MVFIIPLRYDEKKPPLYPGHRTIDFKEKLKK